MQPACHKHIKINYEQCSSVNKVQPDLVSEIRHGIFEELNFGPGIFFSVLLEALGIFWGGWIFAPALFNYLHHLKSGEPPWGFLGAFISYRPSFCSNEKDTWCNFVKVIFFIWSI